jgi:uncharacterized protein (DUF2147 family)
MTKTMVFLAILCPAAAWAGVTGTWRTADGDAKIEMYACGDALCGRIAWMENPEENGRPRADVNNPSPALRERPILGLEILHGFHEDSPGVWSGGKVYDPKTGNEYRGKIRLQEDGTLRLRGYVGAPLFGRSETWTREEER